ncbi:thiosulfate/3-mercaptopyruvate sulfurtransferase [Aquiflexum balticum DSM 16537]|uniref:Thiosulfate/3-mercaptopyruvate sulfurtransferase n=1 Tax=Aquiflexum balticum DSM 16537 TaxID=758820 RepID=A0A1W2HB96_9BACT|nr:sulfurtransferase [Aquiflexum balticum]SMD46149.1 thiosulfate/3-mercaptopyruvate sulfurtransferase [Aquiflexum balticum DSM 16537]
MTTLPPIIQPSELLNLIQNENIILIDASFGRTGYLEKHLSGALHVDLNNDLSDIKDDFAKGGRHPLPHPKKFCELLDNLGISPDSYVIVYDDKNAANAAARFWWTMKAIGHDKIQVLDGGMDAAIRIGFPVKSGEEQIPEKTQYPVVNWLLPLADIHEIDQVSGDMDHLIIDVRENERYRGEKEPIDLIAGHIPGAINIPFASNLDKDGFFLPPEQLKSKYSGIFEGKPAEKIIVHCGSGVTACHTLLAVAYAGMDIPKLYVGSWSEWSRNSRPIGKKD